jgi:hypothetical protein
MAPARDVSRLAEDLSARPPSEDEALAFNGFTRRFQYSGNHVWGTVQHADSAPRSFDRVFVEPVFAFNEVELLVRSTPLQPGWSAVVPLFSEADEDVEHDTITVIRPTTVQRGGHEQRAWIIQFADPAIVSSYTLLDRTREISEIETRQRRTGALLRYSDMRGSAPD